MASYKYKLPDCLNGLCDQATYARWLHRRAQAQVQRDKGKRKRVKVADYKAAIHQAVTRGGDRDYFTGIRLDWKLIGTFDNDTATKLRGGYFRRFWELPTADHVLDSDGKPRFVNGRPLFVICSWRVNDAKGMQSEEEFYDLCENVLAYRQQRK